MTSVAPATAAVREFLASLGYGTVDAGSLAGSWRQETGTPVWGSPYGPCSDEEGRPVDANTVCAAPASAER